MNKKAIAMLSGGLDSILAARLVLEQGIELEAINFLTIFCTCTHKGCQHAATQAAKTLNIPLKIFNITEEYLDVIKNPKHGYGSNMNPCIDCRIFILKKAKEYMAEAGASFLITGEVLGERPMSQRRDAIFLIEKEAGLKGLILRPLSAKLFDPTIPEKEGIIDRERLLDISGRSRKPQIALAKEYGINDYPCPAGGCLLTDPGFAKRMKDLLGHDSLTLHNARLLKFGRHFRLSEDAKLIVGRDEKDNEAIQSLALADDIIIKLKDRQGPLSILRISRAGLPVRRSLGEGENLPYLSDAELIEKAASIASYHTKFRAENRIDVQYWRFDMPDIKKAISVSPAVEEEVAKIRI